VLLLVKDISSSLTAGATVSTQGLKALGVTVSAQGLKALGVTVSAQGLKALPHPPRDPPTERCPAFPSPQCAGRRTPSPAGGAWCAGQLGGRGGRVQVSERIRPAHRSGGTCRHTDAPPQRSAHSPWRVDGPHKTLPPTLRRPGHSRCPP